MSFTRVLIHAPTSAVVPDALFPSDPNGAVRP